mmetsp:Transcript_17646/g.68500  ORF Transcript_17646/g.68500 Transcript_17646/m.68500 type:complete len:505 (-) Transcript_17646:462-1976(-)|eukprot:CAMPEP_0114620130 /NCGR_PEP_ID=MMETSP0168-20121206/8563_1 /TAXON_ID=95228 ORGANISM="Vannella sp., Strain DIVA3 517/6/12" /NCGR_SAMPLE_ID=MMETSP0168 /ASSEMBLY_ACC=CAM_ASM_000044 /LENGTH=504 /DNA_ID=CAMNT_0001831305 /DNA_START=149 /DNA_END=1663 /DNA_ORIENTATION=+
MAEKTEILIRVELDGEEHHIGTVVECTAVPSAGVEEEPVPAATRLNGVCGTRQAFIGAATLLLFVTCVSAVIFLGTVQDSSALDLHYGVVLDLGSSGSRVHIYQWGLDEDGGYDLDSIQPSPVGNPYSKKTSPGVSSYSDDPAEAAKSLKPLLDYAVERLAHLNVRPEDADLVCFATAGMRMLPKDVSAEVSTAIRRFILDSYNFNAREEDIRVISGQEEALFDYVAVQQLLRLFDDEGRERKHIGALDLGGSSVELAFSLSERELNEGPVTRSVEPAYVTDVQFDDKVLGVYGVAYTGLGHNAAFTAILELAVELLPVGPTQFEATFPHPCLHYGNTFTYLGDDGDVTNDVRFVGTGDWAGCVEMTRMLMDRSAPCAFDSCAFNGVYQPPVEGYFVAMDDFNSVAEFFDVGSQPKLEAFVSATREFCSMEWDSVRSSKKFSAKKSRQREYCFEGIFVHELLTYGFGFAEDSSNILFTDTLFGVSLNWGLGAMRLHLQMGDALL